MNQGIIGDIILNSKEWDEVFANLNDEEDEEIRLSVYQEERSGLVELSERIRDDCSSYKNLPKEIENTKACIHVKNKDNKCFIWSLLARMHPVNKNSDRVSKYQKYINELIYSESHFPM